MTDSIESKNEVDETSSTGKNSTQSQFGIGTLFWMNFIGSASIGYLNAWNVPDLLLGCAVVALSCIAIGLVVGWLSANYSEAMFWSVLIALFGYISVAPDPVLSFSHKMSWTIVGAISGACGATLFMKNIWRCALICGVLAFGVMAVNISVAQFRTIDAAFDSFLGPIIAILIVVFIRLVLMVEQQRRIPRYAVATWLLVAVIVGNFIGRF